MADTPTATVRIRYGDREDTYEVEVGTSLDVLSRRHPTALEFECRKASCGICIFEVLEGKENLSLPSEEEEFCLGSMNADANERLACQAKVQGDCIIFLKSRIL